MAQAASTLAVVRASEKELGKAISGLVAEAGDALDASWLKKASVATKRAVKAFGKQKTVKAGLKAMLKSLSADMGSIVSKKAMATITRDVKGLYGYVLKSQATRYNTAFKIGSIDQKVVSAIARESPYWLGRFYDRQLAERIADIGRTVVVEGGMGIREGALEMERVLRSEFALRGGSLYESTIPANFAGRIHEYNKVLTAASASRCRNYADISAMNYAGITRYEISAVMDERTSRICESMNGRIFTVKQGMDLLNRYADAKTPEDFLAESSWVSPERIVEIAGTGDAKSQSNNLAEAGLNLPPYHGLCRTVAIEYES